ncbi:hypothetical protein McanMca71_000255 [Microsporum canis]
MARYSKNFPENIRTLYTFGVEIEFIVTFKIVDFIEVTKVGSIHHSSRWKLLRAVYERIVKTMQDNGFAVNSYLSHYIEASCWTVKQAPSLHLEEFNTKVDQWGVCPVKLMTPVMTYASPSFDSIDSALSLLKQDFDIITNDSCSLSVHVGNIAADTYMATEGKSLQSLGFSLTALENLLCFIWLYQYQLEAIHPPARLCESLCLSPRVLLSHLNSFTVKQRISSCTSMKQLCFLWAGSAVYHGHRPDTFAYSIHDMTAHSSANGEILDSGNQTVRFGQHRSTMDILEIYHWVMLVGHLVRLADTCDPWCRPLGLAVGFDRTQPVKTSELMTVQLLEEIGAAEHANFYGPRLYKNDRTIAKD